ncbi:MAG: hypothetical protein ACKN9T_14475 [Candidatus Methylumidiphilus sp.]
MAQSAQAPAIQPAPWRIAFAWRQMAGGRGGIALGWRRIGVGLA